MIQGFAETGRGQGALDALRNVLYRNLHQRYGPTPEHVLAPIRHAHTEELLEWIDRLVDAASDEDVFATEG